MASWATVPWERSGAANRLATTRPPGRVTRAASRSARRGSPANWNALTPVTASKAPSPNGSDSMSASRRSACGSRSRAMSSRPGLMSTPLGTAPRSRGQDEGQPGAAADVEQASAWPDTRRVEDGLEQRPVVRLGQLRPGPGVGAPQAALDLGGGADHAGATAGLMFWLSRKTLAGS